MPMRARSILLFLVIALGGCVRAIIIDCDASPDEEVCRPDAAPFDAGPLDAGSFDAGPLDAGPIGVTCMTSHDCLDVAGEQLNCAQECALAADGMRRCIPGRAPDGTYCGDGTDSVCVMGECRARRCGDGFVDRLAMPPEYCDDGNTNETDACTNACTRTCDPPATPTCTEVPINSDRCSGGDGRCVTDAAGSYCVANPGFADDTPCIFEGAQGVCLAGRCVTE